MQFLLEGPHPKAIGSQNSAVVVELSLTASSTIRHIDSLQHTLTPSGFSPRGLGGSYRSALDSAS
jgi:hypothetical protein